MVRSIVIICTMVALPAILSAQSSKKLMREGYDLFQDGNYAEAAAKFREAGVTDPNTFKPFFNEGGAWYEADSLDGAAEQFELAQYRAENKKDRAAALHNLGNTYLKKKNYDQAIQYFKHALLQNPQDEETRYNLAYAMAKRQQQQGQQNQDQDKKDDQKQDKKEDQKQQQNKENQKKQDQNQQQQGQKQDISKQQAEQLLKALENEEQDIQKKMLKIKAKPEKREKDW